MLLRWQVSVSKGGSMSLLPGGHSSTVGGTRVSVSPTVPLVPSWGLECLQKDWQLCNVPSYSSLWLPRWRRAVWWTPRSQKQIRQVNWELSQESCGELDVGWLQPSLGSCCHFHTCGCWWLVMYRTSCVGLYHLKHAVFSFIPLLPLCSVLNVFECPFSLWLCKSVSAEKCIQVYRMYMYRIVRKVS